MSNTVVSTCPYCERSFDYDTLAGGRQYCDDCREKFFRFFVVSNAIENIDSYDESMAQFNFFGETIFLPLEKTMYLLHAKMNYLNDYCKAGRLRDYQVYVGGRECLSHQLIEDALRVLFARNPKTWEDIRAWHIDFEHIHPFGDGNGRVGRFLMLRQLWQYGIEIPEMFCTLENFETHRREYYSWF